MILISIFLPVLEPLMLFHDDSSSRLLFTMDSDRVSLRFCGWLAVVCLIVPLKVINVDNVQRNSLKVLSPRYHVEPTFVVRQTQISTINERAR